MKITSTIFIGALSALGLIFVSGCDTIKSAATEMTSSAPVVGPYDAAPSNAIPAQLLPRNPQPASAANPASVAATPAPAPAAAPLAATQPQRVTAPPSAPQSTPRVAPASVAPAPVVVVKTPASDSTQVKGAEKLIVKTPAATTPATDDSRTLKVYARETISNQPAAGMQSTTTAPAQPIQETGTVAPPAAPPVELVFKGPPRKPKVATNNIQWIIAAGIVVFGAVAGVSYLLERRRRAAEAVAIAARRKELEKTLSTLPVKMSTPGVPGAMPKKADEDPFAPFSNSAKVPPPGQLAPVPPPPMPVTVPKLVSK